MRSGLSSDVWCFFFFFIVYFPFQTIFRAFAEPIVQHQHKTVPEQNIENGCTDSNKEKEDHFKIVFKDAHPVRVRKTSAVFTI